MKKVLIIFFLLIARLGAFAQFNESIGTFKNQTAHSVQRSKFDPGYIVAGADGHTVFGGVEAALAKTTLTGSLQWATVYGGIGQDTFNCVRQIYAHTTIPVNGYAAFGSTSSFSSSEDIYFVRTDPNGTPLYSFTFGKKEGVEKGHCMQYIRDVSTGGYGYVMAGQTSSYPYYGNSFDILVIKTDEDGNLIKAKVIGAPGEDIARWIEQTQDGGFVLTGSTTTYSGGDRDIFVIRLDADLKIVWQYIFKHCELPYQDVGYSIIENPLDNSFTVTGYTESFGVNNSSDVFLLNLNSSGAVNWMRTYGTKFTETGLSIDLSSGGKEYVISGSAVNEFGHADALVFKTDMIGNPLWSNLYGSESSPLEMGEEITNNGFDGYVFTGTADASYTINQDFYLVNLSHDGESGGCQREFPRDWKPQKPCTFANFQDVQVFDIKTVCTQYERVAYQAKPCSAEATSGSALRESQPAKEEGFSVMPNPASTAVQIIFHDVSIPAGGGTVAIYNRNGKLVHRMAVTSGDVQIPLAGLPDDLYVIHLITKDGKQYQKRFIKK